MQKYITVKNDNAEGRHNAWDIHFILRNFSQVDLGKIFTSSLLPKYFLCPKKCKTFNVFGPCKGYSLLYSLSCLLSVVINLAYKLVGNINVNLETNSENATTLVLKHSKAIRLCDFFSPVLVLFMDWYINEASTTLDSADADLMLERLNIPQSFLDLGQHYLRELCLRINWIFAETPLIP